jgi:CHAT domain-containing protein
MVLLGGFATETRLKELSESGQLADFAIIHFATHGLLTGELLGAAQPGLILTPPTTDDPGALENDDGYFSAAEIATLFLDADWVVLSACNTAGPSGETSEALSGLARAFFYAGTRALLVSHWAVESKAAVKLATRAFAEMAARPSVGRAEALRFAMRELIENGDLADAHPARWAPFVVVGESRR